MASCTPALRVSFIFGVHQEFRELGSSAASKGEMFLRRTARKRRSVPLFLIFNDGDVQETE